MELGVEVLDVQMGRELDVLEELPVRSLAQK